MSFFGNAKDAAPAVTGTDVLREAMRIKFRHGPSVTAALARDLNLGVGAIESWASGSGQLPPAALNTIAKRVFGDTASFDAERNLLVREKREATSIGEPPPRWKPPPKPVPPPEPPRAKVQPPPPPPPKPGWAD